MAGMTTNSSDSLISDSLTDRESQPQTTEGELVRENSSSMVGDGSESSQANTPDEKPAWFQKQQEKRTQKKAKPLSSRRKSHSSIISYPISFLLENTRFLKHKAYRIRDN